MGIIRFSDEEVFGTDSHEYEILARAVTQIKGIPGNVIEIGTRRGGSAKIIIDTLVANGDTNRNMFCVDPYGNIEIECTNKNITMHIPGVKIEGDPQSLEITQPLRFDYNDQMRNRIVPSLMYYAFDKGLNFQFFFLEDTEFFDRYGDGVPVYSDFKTLANEYAFVFFDGPHTTEIILDELDFFVERSVPGSVFVFDDHWMADHDKIEQSLFYHGFVLLEKGQVKASYKKKS